jgi:hypothetical protein
MRNLLYETLEFLSINGLDEKDIKWVDILGEGLVATWEEFKKIADDTYFPGREGNDIDMCLRIVATGWWLERNNDRWEICFIPELYGNESKLERKHIFDRYWMNENRDKNTSE